MTTSTGILIVPYHGTLMSTNESLAVRKRLAVWRNSGRNELAAGLAVGLARRPKATLRGLGVDPERVKLPGRTDRRVVLLAETAEHAERLGELLPGWAVLTAVPVTGEDAGWGPEMNPDSEPPPGTVVTLAYAALDGVACDVLVRATAGTGQLNWASFPAVNRARRSPALVVDIADAGGGRETRDAEVRRREYREHGLRELNVSPKGERNT